MLTLLGELKKRENCELRVVLPARGPMEKELQTMKIEYVIIPFWYSVRKLEAYHNTKEGVKEILNQIAVCRMKSEIKVFTPDYVISNSVAEDVGARAAQALQVKHIYYVREFLEEDFEICFRKPNRAKTLIENADKVIFISNAIAQKYVNKYHIDRYKIIYDGIHPEQYICRNHSILNQSKIHLIQVGRLCEGKGTLETIKVVEKLEQERYVLDLYGYGEPSYVRKLEQYIEENHLGNRIHLHEFDDQIADRIKEKDILIMNSRSEGLGRVTLEGMLAGCLVLGRETGATAEIIQNGVNGLTFCNSKELEHLLSDVVMSQKNKCRELAQNGQRYALEQFSPEKNAREFLNWVEE